MLWQFDEISPSTHIHLLDVAKNVTAYVGYEFGCKWDDEHGLGIMTHRDSIISIGGADIAFLAWIAEKDISKNTGIAKPWWKFWKRKSL